MADEAARLIIADLPPSVYLEAVEWVLRRLGCAAAVPESGRDAGGNPVGAQKGAGPGPKGPPVLLCAPPLSYREVERGPLPGSAPDPIPALRVVTRLGAPAFPVRETPRHLGAATLVVLDADNLLEAWQLELFRRAGGETRLVLLGCSGRPHNHPQTFHDTMERFSGAPFARILRGAGT